MKGYISTLLLLTLASLSYAQSINVKGVIQDSDLMPIPGANVIVKNTNTGAISDFDGNFVINNVSAGATLLCSYIGFVTQEIVVTNEDSLVITLLPDVAQLDEVVVIGYGTQRKKEITGAVSVVSNETIEELKPVRVEQALQGQVAGVNITSSSGSPGAASNIQIRGISTNGDSRPLILVDGNVIEDLSVINPNDIESINVLKDATAGIYGVRAANGVVLIKTKTGRKEMPTTIEYSAYGGFQQTTRKIPVLNASEYALLANEAFAAGGQSLPFPNISGLGVGTDWQDAIFEDAPIFNHAISLKGGGKKSGFSVSSSFLTQDGIVGRKKSNFTRLTKSLNYNLDILKNLKFNTGILFTATNKKN